MTYNKDTRVRVKFLTTKGTIRAVKYITYGDYRKKKNKNPNSIKLYRLN